MQEMLEEEKKMGHNFSPNDKKVSITLNRRFLEKVDKIVERHKKFRRSYSRTKWFLEAVYKKLEKEHNASYYEAERR